MSTIKKEKSTLSLVLEHLKTTSGTVTPSKLFIHQYTPRRGTQSHKKRISEKLVKTYLQQKPLLPTLEIF